jgi:hypothetical protein
MTNQQAASKAKKRWGKAFYIRNSESMSSPESRDKSRERYKKSKAEADAIEDEIRRRLSELDWYQELLKRKRELRKESENAQGRALYYRFSVGKSNGMFTTILGQGDTWEEAFAAAEKASL